MVDVADSAGPADRLHHLLLALTGRLDDDALNSVRELVGFGQLDAAAEMLTGSLLAGPIPVTSGEQRQLEAVLEAANSRPSLASQLVLGNGVNTEHRFTQPEDIADLADTLRPLTPRLPALRAVWCTARTTAAGDVAGAVPRRVLLAEVGSASAVSPTGHQLLRALRRADIECSVDVFSTGTELPEYHRGALANAGEVQLGAAPTAPPTQAEQPRRAANRAERRQAEPAVQGSSAPSAWGFDAAGHTPSPIEHDHRPDISDIPMPEPPQGIADEAPRRDQPRERRSRHEAGGTEAPDAWIHRPNPQAEPPRAEPPPAERRRPEPPPPEPPRPDPLAVEPPAEPIGPEPPHPEPPQPEPRAERAPEQPPRSAATEFFPDPATSERYSETRQVPTLDPAATRANLGSSPAGDGPPADRSDEEGERNPRVPAAVDAKLTDRERNLLRKLHEELAQREQGRSDEPAQPADDFGHEHGQAPPDPRTTTVPGNGSVPPVTPHSPAYQQPPVHPPAQHP